VIPAGIKRCLADINETTGFLGSSPPTEISIMEKHFNTLWNSSYCYPATLSHIVTCCCRLLGKAVALAGCVASLEEFKPTTRRLESSRYLPLRLDNHF